MFFQLVETGKKNTCGKTPELDKELSLYIKKLASRGKIRIPKRLNLREIDFAVIDLETTGFYPSGGDEIISIGAVLIRGGRIYRRLSFNRLVNPYRNIPEEVIRLTGISPNQVSKACSIYKVMPDFLSFIDGNVLIGHMINFDLSFLNRKLKLCRTKIYNKSLDTANLAKALLPTLSDYSLDGLLTRFNIGNEGRHTALGDALLTAQLFLALLELGFEKNTARWCDLDNCLKLSEQSEFIQFGI